MEGVSEKPIADLDSSYDKPDCTCGERIGKNRSLPRSDHAGARDCRDGMFRHEGLCPVYAPTPSAVAYLLLGIVGVRGGAYVAAMSLSAGNYKPRDAEHAVLYRLIDEHLDAFLETARRHADGTSLPAFVEQEFRDFLTCGVLAQASRACGAPSAPSSGWCRSRARGHAGASSAASRRNRRRALLKRFQNGRPSSSIRGEFQRR